MSSSSLPASSSSLSHVDVPPGPDPGHGIRLHREVQSRYVVNAVDGFRFRVTARDGRNMPDEIFRFLRGPGRAVGTEDDVFDGVCSPPDIEEFPAGGPAAGQAVQFFRRAEIDLLFRSQTQAEEAWLVIVDEVTHLVKTLDVMDKLKPAETAVIGDPRPAGTDSSSSIGG